jgi:hypothetical protein
MCPLVIAERVLRAADDPSKSIRVKLYAPENAPPDGETRPELFGWRCAYELEGLAGMVSSSISTSRVVGGADSLDALLTALVAIRGALDACFTREGIQFTWPLIAHAEGGHAIPRQMTTYLGPAHERELGELMAKEDMAFLIREPEFMARLQRAREGTADEE